jgi:ABC-2 type transport system ATP-binding protein
MINREKLLEIAEVTKVFGTYAALSRVSMQVERGEIVGLLGPNGAGKTTLLEIIEGLQTATSGSVRINGRTPNELSVAERGAIGLVFQRYALPGHLRVGQLLSLLRALYAEEGNELVEILGLQHLLDSRIRQLSVGQQQRVAMCCALFGMKSLLLLDEPSSALDIRSRLAIRQAVLTRRKQQHFGAVIATHQMEEALALCDRVYFIEKGAVRLHGDTRALVAAEPARCRLDFFRPADEVAFRNVQAALGRAVEALDGRRCRIQCEAKDIPRLWAMLLECEAVHGFQADAEVGRSSLEQVYLRVVADAA